ncbi:GyrI-like domain-containing protein [Methanosarcina barkeri]|uniref:GyrI-like domain-containing protein n=1 Tax=Methanosarcina barkeri TaxID=2208 RepID=UPI00311E6901
MWQDLSRRPENGSENLPAIRAISVVYRGPYPGVEAGYNQIFSYAKENNLETLSPDRELYFNNPEEVSEEELMTEIQVPIKEK